MAPIVEFQQSLLQLENYKVSVWHFLYNYIDTVT